LRHALKGKLRCADFQEVHLVHNSLPELDLSEVNLETRLAGIPMRSPLFINALTGGTPEAYKINRSLARVAREGGFAMAVGSQRVGLQHESAEESFRVVRRENPGGIVWANLGAYADTREARAAVEMIEADGLQIHLNVPQELAMKEGDVSFKGNLARINAVCEALKVPVMAKEVGFGMAAEQARELKEAGVQAIDVGGRGGTNFLNIETRRRDGNTGFSPQLSNYWGIPTAVSLAEVLSSASGEVDVVASGGVNTSLNLAKSLAMGARAAGIAGMAVKILCRFGEKALLRRLQKLERELVRIMVMTGAGELEELRKKPLVVTGFTKEWIRQRGIGLEHTR